MSKGRQSPGGFRRVEGGSVRSEEMRGGAAFDSTGRYRYALWRVWDRDADRVAFVMLNPSTADARRDDPTIRRCIGFARAWGFGSMEVVNLFAYRTPRPDVLRRASRPVGPENDRHVLRAARRAERVVVAWGGRGSWRGRDEEVMRMLARGGTIYCIGRTASGHPRHPLYARKELGLVRFQPGLPSAEEAG